MNMVALSPNGILLLFSLINVVMTTTPTPALDDALVNGTLTSSYSNMTSAADQDQLSATLSNGTVTSSETTTSSSTSSFPSSTTTRTTASTGSGMRDGAGMFSRMLRNVNIIQLVRQFMARDDIRNSFSKPYGVNQRCYDEVVDYIDALIGEKESPSSRDYDSSPWALKMFDATGKPPAGLLRGQFQWVGHYDECLDVHAKIPNGTYLGSRRTARNVSTEFRARYCRAMMVIPPTGVSREDVLDFRNWTRETTPLVTNWGLCVPESCGGLDVLLLLTQGTMESYNLPITWVECFDRDYDLDSDGWAIFALCLLSLTGAVVLISTVVESAIYYGYIPLPQAAKENGITENGPSTDDNLHNAGNGIANNELKASTSNDRTPLSIDTRPKDVLRDELTPPEAMNEHPAGSKSRKATLAIRILQAFSVRYNGRKIMATSTSSDPNMLPCIQGMRVVSIMWIVLGHTYSAVIPNPYNMLYSNAYDFRETFSRLTFTFVGAANFAVDTFFVISGLLVMKFTLRELRRGKGQTVKFWVTFYLHRFWRLTPVYMMVLMTGTTLYDLFVDGPLKSKESLMFATCDTSWWTNLLYINNLAKVDEICMLWSWYLAVDMQLFWISPIFILLIHRKYRIGLFAIIATIILGSLAAFLLVLDNPGIMATALVTGNLEYFKHVYIKPWVRVVAFAVGMLVAVILEDAPDKQYISKLKAFFIWIFLTGVVIFIILIAHGEMDDFGGHWAKGTMALYETVGRLVWSIYIAWIIYACQNGLGGFATDFLNWTGFQPLARLTYTVYLVHPMIITFFLYERNAPFETQDTVMICLFCGYLVISYLVAALYTLMFEAPLLAVEKVVLKQK